MKQEYINLIKNLSDPKLKGRSPGSVGHELTRKLICKQFMKMNVEPLFGDNWEQSYHAHNGVQGHNLVANKKGSSDRWIILGAHYDHIKNCPGADDNAASIGIILATIHALSKIKLDVNLVIVFFDLEEQPFFKTRSMGSYDFLQNFRKQLRGEKLIGAFILDLCGHDIPIKGRENAIFSIGANTCPALATSLNNASKNVQNIAAYQFKSHPLLHLSDNYFFDTQQIPHLFITSGYSPYYHTPQDTFDKLNVTKIANVAKLLENTIIDVNHHSNLTKSVVFDKTAEIRELERFINIELPMYVKPIDVIRLIMNKTKKIEKTTLTQLQLEISNLLKGRPM